MEKARKKRIALLVASVIYTGFPVMANADNEGSYPITTEYYEAHYGTMSPGSNVYVSEYYADGVNDNRVVSSISQNGTTLGDMSVRGVDNNEGDGGSAILTGIETEGQYAARMNVIAGNVYLAAQGGNGTADGGAASVTAVRLAQWFRKYRNDGRSVARGDPVQVGRVALMEKRAFRVTQDFPERKACVATMALALAMRKMGSMVNGSGEKRPVALMVPMASTAQMEMNGMPVAWVMMAMLVLQAIVE